MEPVRRQRVGVAQLQRGIPREEFDYPLLTSVLGGYAGPRQKIHALLRSRVIVRVKKGLYVFGPEYSRRPICREALANLIFGPSRGSTVPAMSSGSPRCWSRPGRPASTSLARWLRSWQSLGKRSAPTPPGC